MDRDGPERECARCEHEAPERFGGDVDGDWYCLVCRDWAEEQNGIK